MTINYMLAIYIISSALSLTGATDTVSYKNQDSEFMIVNDLDIATAETELDNMYLNLSDEDIRLFSIILYYECRGECKDCQLATASCILNRMMIQKESLESVIFADKQFATAKFVEDCDLTDDQLADMRDVVIYICKNGPTIPEYVTYFREGEYHNWPGMVDLYNHCTTYFSYDAKIYDMFNMLD